MASNSTSLIPTPKTINQHVAFTNLSPVAFLTATDISNNKEIRISTSDASSSPLFSCGGPTNLLPHFQARKSIVKENMALERFVFDKKQVRNHVLVYEMHLNITNSQVNTGLLLPIANHAAVLPTHTYRIPFD
jgi:hypothetical protein